MLKILRNEIFAVTILYCAHHGYFLEQSASSESISTKTSSTNARYIKGTRSIWWRSFTKGFHSWFAPHTFFCGEPTRNIPTYIFRPIFLTLLPKTHTLHGFLATPVSHPHWVIPTSTCAMQANLSSSVLVRTFRYPLPYLPNQCLPWKTITPEKKRLP